MTAAPRGNVLLTVDDITEWRKELTDIDHMMAELREQGERLARKIEMATFFLPNDTGDEEGALPSVNPEPEPEPADAPEAGRRVRGGLISPQPMPVLVYGQFAPTDVLLPGEVVRRIEAIDGVSGPPGAIKNNVYTALQRLTQRGQLRRDASGAYSLAASSEDQAADGDLAPSNENEPPNGDAVGGSETEGVAAPSIENRGEFDELLG